MKTKIMSSTLNLIKLEKYVFTFTVKAGKITTKVFYLLVEILSEYSFFFKTKNKSVRNPKSAHSPCSNNPSNRIVFNRNNSKEGKK